MGDSFLDRSCVVPLSMQHEGKLFTGGLCLNSASLDNLNRARDQFLHSQEQAHLNTLWHPKAQKSYLIGRRCAKKVLSTVYQIKNPTEILIENGVFRQPVIYYPEARDLKYCNLQVSISHTENLGAALVFPEAHPMAIDVETVDSSKDEVILSQLTNYEKNMSFPNMEDSTFPFLQLIWTIKEALSKVLKCGLTVPFELLEVQALILGENIFQGFFKNFPQYQSLSFILDGNVCSLVFPKKTILELKVSSIQEAMSQSKVC